MRYFLIMSLCLITIKSSAQTGSRISARASYNYNGAKFYLVDTTSYVYYYPYLGGDLSSRYISYSDAVSLRLDTVKGILNRTTKSLQYFDGANHLLTKTNYSWKGLWEEADQELYTTTTDDSILTKITQVWNTGTHLWENSVKREYKYGVAKKCTASFLYTWDNTAGAWVGIECFLSDYDAREDLVSKRYQIWDVTGAVWQDVVKDSFEYNAIDQVTVHSSYVWDGSSHAWRSSQKMSYSYDSKKFLISELSESWDDASKSWLKTQLFSYNNDAKGNILEHLIQNWDDVSGGWVDFRKHLLTYDAKGNILTDSWQNWNVTKKDFINSQLISNTYDAGNNLIQERAFVWDIDSGKWAENELDSFAYNTFSQLIYSTYFTGWDATLSAWKHRSEDQEFYYYYSAFTSSVNETGQPNLDLVLYPVPAFNMLTVKFNALQQQDFICEFADVSGRICKRWDIIAKKNFADDFSTNDLPPGTYIFSIRGSKGEAADKKILISH